MKKFEELFTELYEKLKKVLVDFWEAVKPLVDKLRKYVDNYFKDQSEDDDEPVGKTIWDEDFEPVDVDGIVDAVIRELYINWEDLKHRQVSTKRFRDKMTKVIAKEVKKNDV